MNTPHRLGDETAPGLERWEVDRLWRQRDHDRRLIRLGRFRRLMLAYIVASIALGILGVLVAIWLGGDSAEGTVCVTAIVWFVITIGLGMYWDSQTKRIIGEGATLSQIKDAYEQARARSALRIQLIEAQRATGGELSVSGDETAKGSLTSTNHSARS